MRIMIVDDELIQRQALAMLVSKYIGTIQDTVLADSGREALRLMDKEPADIVCVDYRMPGISGIEVIREMKRKYPMTIFILITAFSEFSIAQNALKLAVHDYILKPVKKEEFISTISSCVQEILQRRQQEESWLTLKEYVRELEPAFEKELFGAFLLKKETVIRRFVELKRIKEGAKGFCAIINMSECWKKINYELLIGTLKSQLAEQCYVIARENLDNRMVVFVVEKEKLCSISEFKTMIVRMVSEPIKMGIGCVSDDIFQLHSSYKMAVEAEKKCSREMRIVYEEEEQIQTFYEYPYSLEKQIISAITNKNAEKAERLISELYHMILAYAEGDQEKIMEELKKLQAALLRLCAEYEVECYEIDAINDCDHIYEGCQFLAKKMIIAFSEKRQQGKDAVIVYAIEYIKENYFTNLSLDDIASRFQISIFYFTKLFKAKMGYTFVEYLTYVRIENAKKLMLQDPDIKINEVCELVGYNDPKYFCKAFKKLTGMTPAEFKKR